LDYNLTDAEIKSFSADLNALAETLEKVPEKARQMLLRFIKKSSDGTYAFVDEFATERYSYEGKNLETNVNILKRYGLADFSKDMDGNDIIELSCNNKEGINFWGDIKKFCEIENISLDQIIIDLNFAVFDDKYFIKKSIL
jgi:hypothetical protein